MHAVRRYGVLTLHYIDAGHERPDVVEARRSYVNVMKEYASQMEHIVQPQGCSGTKCKECDGKGCVGVQRMERGGDEIVRVYQDECIVASNEG